MSSLVKPVLNLNNEDREEARLQNARTSEDEIPSRLSTDGKTSTPTVLWTKEEDELLTNVVAKEGAGQWDMISRHFQLRNGKQCRERWRNQLNPAYTKDSLTKNEEWIVFILHEALGRKWSKIAKHLPGRSDHFLKTHWNSRMEGNQLAFEERLSRLKQKQLERKSDAPNILGFSSIEEFALKLFFKKSSEKQSLKRSSSALEPIENSSAERNPHEQEEANQLEDCEQKVEFTSKENSKLKTDQPKGKQQRDHRILNSLVTHPNDINIINKKCYSHHQTRTSSDDCQKECNPLLDNSYVKLNQPFLISPTATSDCSNLFKLSASTEINVQQQKNQVTPHFPIHYQMANCQQQQQSIIYQSEQAITPFKQIQFVRVPSNTPIYLPHLQHQQQQQPLLSYYNPAQVQYVQMNLPVCQYSHCQQASMLDHRPINIQTQQKQQQQQHSLFGYNDQAVRLCQVDEPMLQKKVKGNYFENQWNQITFPTTPQSYPQPYLPAKFIYSDPTVYPNNTSEFREPTPVQIIGYQQNQQISQDNFILPHPILVHNPAPLVMTPQLVPSIVSQQLPLRQFPTYSQMNPWMNHLNSLSINQASSSQTMLQGKVVQPTAAETTEAASQQIRIENQRSAVFFDVEEQHIKVKLENKDYPSAPPILSPCVTNQGHLLTWADKSTLSLKQTTGKTSHLDFEG